eukprot:gene30468-39714_t
MATFNVVSETSKPFSRRIFEKYDTDNTGSISRAEFVLMLEDHGIYLVGDALELAMLSVDCDSSGQVTYDEFLNWKKISSFESLNISDETIIDRRKAFLELFRKYDSDKSGAISKAEFSSLYKELAEVEIVSHDLESTFGDIDVNGDGRIEYNELVLWLEKQFVSLGYI